MEKVVEYEVVKSAINDCYDEPLSYKVNVAIEKGWQPLGPAQVYVLSPSVAYMFQTMVKYEKSVV